MHKPFFFAQLDCEHLQQPHLISTWRADFLTKFRAAMIVGYYNTKTQAGTISCKAQCFLQLLPKNTFSLQNVPREPLALRVRVLGLELRVLDLGFRVWGVDLRVPACML